MLEPMITFFFISNYHGNRLDTKNTLQVTNRFGSIWELTILNRNEYDWGY